MNCKKCKFAKFLDDDKTSFHCSKPISAMKTNCILRQLYWLLYSNKELGKKVEKLMDKTIEDINEGDEWKKPPL